MFYNKVQVHCQMLTRSLKVHALQSWQKPPYSCQVLAHLDCLHAIINDGAMRVLAQLGTGHLDA